MGVVGGSIFHFCKGYRHSPLGTRLFGGFERVQMNVVRIGGSFAAWAGLFSVCECSMVFLRQKEDPWNSIVAGAASGGLLKFRQGFRPAARSAAFGGVILAIVEGAGFALNRAHSAPQPNPPPSAEPVPSNVDISANIGRDGAPNATSSSRADESSSSWFGGLFGGGKKDNRKVDSGGGGRKNEVSKSFGTPSPPVNEK
ncbi:Mitochondrial import inner membrane translocase subunit TIM17-2 [Acorus gramineus]|uniref:Mitochondrial import inner membrane translocase subunit TIM17-2 n=1 Tax=Acorus gramineus TaxID=55184 RepID=A0AAV9ALV8_ACOGR|nr:Mitochondrial import inner membrane translocase subunit TIM17-2 [Acorus gramineus]